MNKKIGFGVLGIVVLFAVFYGGIVYGKSQIPARGNQAFGQNGTGGTRGTRNMGGFTTGKIISKDTNSITVQLVSAMVGQTGGPASTSLGGSKIVFLDSNTVITKSVSGTATDLAIGTQVSVTGTANTDGSENAQSVQIRPNTPPVLK